MCFFAQTFLCVLVRFKVFVGAQLVSAGDEKHRWVKPKPVERVWASLGPGCWSLDAAERSSLSGSQERRVVPREREDD